MTNQMKYTALALAGCAFAVVVSLTVYSRHEAPKAAKTAKVHKAHKTPARKSAAVAGAAAQPEAFTGTVRVIRYGDTNGVPSDLLPKFSPATPEAMKAVRDRQKGFLE